MVKILTNPQNNPNSRVWNLIVEEKDDYLLVEVIYLVFNFIVKPQGGFNYGKHSC